MRTSLTVSCLAAASLAALATAFVATNLAACAAEVEDESTLATDEKELYAGEAVAGKADWSLDPCTARGWYGDGVCDWFCPKRDSDCAPPTLFANPKGKAAVFPVVLHHGFAGGHGFIFAYQGVREGLTADGHRVYQTEVPPFASVPTRAAELKKVVDRALTESGKAKVNLIVHSMGGLDARYLIGSMGYGDRVASLTTISTPHRGTNAADFALKIVPGKTDPVINALFELFGMTFNDLSTNTDLRAAWTALAEGSAADFNAKHPNDARVYYQSWAGVSSVLGLSKYGRDPGLAKDCDGKLVLNTGTFDRVRGEFVALAPLIGPASTTGPWHDGLVTVKSSKWGTFRGCIPADHSEEVGQSTAGWPNPTTGFDAVTFYRTMAFDLAARGY